MPTETPSRPSPPPDPSRPSPPPAPARTGLRRLTRGAFADLTPLRHSPDYRRLWFGQTVSSIGQQMTTLAVGIQVYALTGSTFLTGLVGICSLVPLVVFGLYGGAIADRVDRRRLGLVGSGGLAAVSALLAAQALLDLRSITLLYAAVAAYGAQSAYLADTAAFAATLYAMWRLPAMRPQSTTGKRATVLDGLRFLRTQPNLRTSFAADLAAMIFGLPRALFPAIVLPFYGGDAGTVGLLAAAPAVGALAGGLFSGWIGRIHRHGVAVLTSVAAWGLAIAAFGLVRNLPLGLLLLAAAGCADTVSMIFRNTMMQVAAPDEMRGRLQGVFIVVVAGGPRLGDFESGTVSSLTTPTLSILTGGLACVAVVLYLALRRPAFRHYDARHPTP
ncbi:MFS transporter [Kitasatospora cineracea]|uniref:MFS transporter n=1 Tax=Kitasatospora cineracea TaxID=88074 RepID=UPI0037B4C5F1